MPMRMAVKRKAKIPKAPARNFGMPKTSLTRKKIEFDTWTLFLVSDPGWLLGTSTSQMVNLYKQYQAFGSAIGFNNVAIWLTRTLSDDEESDPAAMAADYDAERAAEFSMYYGLSPEESPHVVVTSKYPDLSGPRGDHVLLSLGGTDKDTSIGLLKSLVKQIHTGNLNQRRLDSTVYWTRIEDNMRAWMLRAAKLSSKIRLKINVGFLVIDFRGRPAPGRR
jgi:hypothetical protein